MGPIVIVLAMSFVHLAPSMLSVRVMVATFSMISLTISSRDVKEPSNSPIPNQVPLRVVSLLTIPGVNMSADNSTAQPMVRSVLTTLEIVSLFIPFCKPMNTPSSFRCGSISCVSHLVS